MKKIVFRGLPFIPASHENPNYPGVLKKILFEKKDFPKRGIIQMINWAVLPVGKSFVSHYHEDMDEIFIIISGKVKIWVNKEKDVLETGDAVLVPMKKVHKMKNISKEDVNYLIVGVSLDKGGRTITV